jgi:hypothetical protein
VVRKRSVPRAIITHCGSEIVTGDEGKLSAKLRVMAAERGVDVRIAYDGMSSSCEAKFGLTASQPSC